MFLSYWGRGSWQLLRPMSVWLFLLLSFCQSKRAWAEHFRETLHEGDLFRGQRAATESVVFHSKALDSTAEANRTQSRIGLRGQVRFDIFKMVLWLVFSELRIYSISLEHPNLFNPSPVHLLVRTHHENPQGWGDGVLLDSQKRENMFHDFWIVAIFLFVLLNVLAQNRQDMASKYSTFKNWKNAILTALSLWTQWAVFYS